MKHLPLSILLLGLVTGCNVKTPENGATDSVTSGASLFSLPKKNNPTPDPIKPPPPEPTPIPVTPVAGAHKIGFNGEGFFKNVTTYDIQFLKDLNTTVVIRFPGGGDTKFSHPTPPSVSSTAKGWNNKLSEIEGYFNTYLPGASGSTFELSCDGPGVNGCYSNWCTKGQTALTDEKSSQISNYNSQQACNPNAQLDGTTTCNYLEKIVLLSKQLNLEVVYNVNPMFATPDEVVTAIDYLRDNGVKIAAIEMGNETYFKINYNFKFSCYKDDILPLVSAIKSNFPDLNISLPVSNFNNGEEKPGDSSVQWNDGVEDFMVSVENNLVVGGASQKMVDAVVVHYYLTEDQCSDAWNAIPDYVTPTDLSNSNYYSGWNNALSLLMSCVNYKDAFIAETNLAREKYPEGTKIFVTEFNIKYSSDWGNTLVQGSWLFEQFMKVAPNIDITLAHNGISGELFGLISQYKKRVDGSDLTKLGGAPATDQYNVRRLGYWAFKLAAQALNTGALPIPTTPIALSAKNTDYKYYFNNMGEAITPVLSYDTNKFNLIVSSEYIQGTQLYSSAGYSSVNATYSKDKSQPYVDLNNITSTILGSTNVLPKNSFGVITYRIEKKR